MTSSPFVSAAATAAVALCWAGASYAQTCAKDSDCGPGLSCRTMTSTSCTGATAPCAKDMPCDTPVVAPVCTEVTRMSCVEKTCNADAECDDGFFCQPSIRGECSGSSGRPGGGTSGAGGGAGGDIALAPLPPDSNPTCTTTISYPGTCQLKAIPCTADSDCPASLSCKDSPTAVSGGSGVAVDLGGDVPTKEPALVPQTTTTTGTATATSTATATGTATTTRTCQPPNTAVTPVDTGVKGGDTASPGGSGGSTGGRTPTYGGADAGAGQNMPPAETADAGATTKGGSGPLITTSTNTSTATQSTTQTAATTGGGGCSVTGNGSASLAWLAILGALFVAARRRRS